MTLTEAARQVEKIYRKHTRGMKPDEMCAGNLAGDEEVYQFCRNARLSYDAVLEELAKLVHATNNAD